MLVSVLIKWWLENYLLQRVLRFVGGGLLGLLMLGWIAASAGPSRGTVVVHVVEQDVQLRVGPETFRVRDRMKPVVCELPAGEYTLTLTRGDRTLDEQRFQIHRGEWTTLSAFDQDAYRSRSGDRGEPVLTSLGDDPAPIATRGRRGPTLPRGYATLRRDSQPEPCSK